MESVIVGEEEIPIVIVYSEKRKTVGLTVKQTGEVVLRLPKTVTKEEGIAFAQSKADWIAKHRQAFCARETTARHYTDGERIPFCGQELTVRRQEGKTVRAEIEENILRITAPEGTDTEAIRDAVIFLYRRAALPQLREMVAAVSAAAGVEPPLLRIRLQEKKWGCCTPKNGIILNVKILLAPPIVIQYLVVHEVAHIKHRHHQATFWAAVKRLMPNFQEAESLLKSEGWKWIF